jgi:hypothetical protein
MGQLLGVKKLATGSLGKIGSMFMVNMRMVDVQTGKLTKVVSRDIKGDIEEVVGNLPAIAESLVEEFKSGTMSIEKHAEPVAVDPLPEEVGETKKNDNKEAAIIDVSAYNSTASESSTSSKKPTAHFMDLGVGLGLDYGGIVGLNIAVIPIPYVSIFAAAGWEIVSLGWNVGAKIHIIPQTSKHIFRMNLKVMYGVNGATTVIGASEYDKVFLGVTPGVGLEFMFGRTKSNGFDFDLNFPIHGKDFQDQLDRMENDPIVGSVSAPLPFAFSLGYHHEF